MCVCVWCNPRPRALITCCARDIILLLSHTHYTRILAHCFPQCAADNELPSVYTIRENLCIFGNRSQARVLLYTTGACSNDMCCVSHNNDVDIALYGIAAAQRPSCICIVNVPALLFRLLAKYGVGYLPQWKTERARVYCQFIIVDREMENVRAISIFGIHVPRVRGDRCWW